MRITQTFAAQHHSTGLGSCTPLAPASEISIRKLTMTSITKAVFPVAGLGTRFLPATKAMPKELLPIIDKPIIQYAVEEAIAAGITDLVFITGRTKRAIEDHFDANPELERELPAKGKDDIAAAIHGIILCSHPHEAVARIFGSRVP